jgi:dTDP-4-amino-4,6-dideoxygalactose transaminase
MTKQLILSRYLIPRRGCVVGPHIEEYERAFAAAVGARFAVGLHKGRMGFYCILKALGLRSGDEIIMPAYTCLVVPAASARLGIVPVYVDIEPTYFGLDPNRVSAAITPRTRAIMIQHTYGWPAPGLEQIVEIARNADVPIVEDCCHALGTRLRGTHVGNFGAGGFFSSQWSKPFTTGLGGMLVMNDAALYERVRRVRDAEASRLSPRMAAQLAMQGIVYETLVYPRTMTAAQRAYRWLGKKSLIAGSTSKQEYVDSSGPYLFAMSEVQAAAGLYELTRIDAGIAHRRRLGAWYAETIRAEGWEAPPDPPRSDVTPVRFPVRVANKDEVLQAASRHMVEMGDWFVRPLHSHLAAQEQFGYRTGMCPNADRAANEVVNLPTHPRVSDRQARRVVQFLNRVGRRPARAA